ncbi:MAG: Hsp33 family molecular chaperone HslO [Desulfuromonadales bacterium]|nr:Hsp33 family molecular chaperone HslO [Desulfuromonadales bacterium]
MVDHLLRALSRDGSVRVCVAETTLLVEEIRARQQSDPTATVAIGRLVTGAALMGSLLKGPQRLALTVEGNGPLQRLLAEADAAGRVRASLKQPVAGLPPRQGRYDVAGAVGRAGFLHVVKDLGLKEPYRGMVQLQSSEIAADLAYYFTASEQTPSSLGLGVELDDAGRVAVAGGFLLQLLPQADPELAGRLEARIAGLSPTTRLLAGGGPEQVLDRLLADIDYRLLAETPLQFHCPCSQEQSRRLLALLGRDDLARLHDEQETVVVTCEFCRQDYGFDRSALQEIMANLPE